MKVTLGCPTLVTEGRGHLWFPGMASLPTGEIAMGCSAVPDKNSVPAVGSYAVSADRGHSWSDLTLIPYGMLLASFRKGEDLALLPFRWFHGNPAQTALSGHLVTLSNHGRSFRVDRHAVRVDGLPRATQEWTPGEASLVTGSNILPLPDGRLFTLIYGTFAGDAARHNRGFSLLAIESRDGGARWQYVTTVADWTFNPAWNEGPCESSLLELADRSLMVVFRVGDGVKYFLHKCVSRDGGKSWSRPEALPTFGVLPSLVRVAGGGLLLATGRPGIFLWHSADGRGAHWESSDVIEHHNRVVTKPEYRIEPTPEWPRFHTTSYTCLLEYAPNKLLMIYDRIPCRWEPVPENSPDQNRIFVLPIEIN